VVVEPVDPLQRGLLDLVKALHGHAGGSARSCPAR
jgi:hypothetical protein